MKVTRPHRSKALTSIVCILTLALFTPCFPLAEKLVRAADRNPRNQWNFGPPGAGLPNLDHARESRIELQSTAERADSPALNSVADRPVLAEHGAFDSSPSSEHRPDTPALGRMNAAGQEAPNAITSFNDVPPTSPYYSYIEIIKNLQVTLGCNTNLYCPDDPVKRDQMAAFIMRSLGEPNPPTPPTQRFADVPPSNAFYNFVDRLAALNITAGCDANNYCPALIVTRGQMVTFLERAVGRGNPPAPAQQRFVDVPSTNPFYRFIESFVQHGMARGVMNVFMRGTPNDIGLDGQHFLPDQVLTRAEMAALLVIEFGWMDGYTSNARLDPTNRTGQSGEDLFSGNCNWSLPLLGLPGRAGLDLGLSLSYNSLVWTKVSPAMIFNADNGFSPGFRLGFPVIQTKYSNSQAGGEAYMMVSPSGARVELRRVGSTNEYDSADSSYLKLDDNGSTLLLRTMDGTQLTYSPSNSPVNNSRSGDYRCTQIKDRNGNYLTINYYSAFGYINTIVDTLGRTVTFNYDGLGRLTSITQMWGSTSHTWASFGYSSLTINTKFCDPALGSCSSGTPNMSVCGPSNNGVISVLTQVTFADLSNYVFDYTTWGQVWRMKHYADASHQLGYTSYNLPVNETVAQSDCPRFTTRTDYAEYWGTVNTVYGFDLGTGQGQVTTPDGTLTKETHPTSGYRKGLTTQVDTYSSDNLSTAKKTSIITWTQDNTGLSYPLNPRVTQTDVYDDSSNHRKTTISYSSLTLPPNSTLCKLPADVREYASDATTVLRKTHTDYYSSLLNQHIIGLPSARYLYDSDTQNATPLSKVTFGYDAGSLTGVSPVQHDANYGTGFTTRGNLTTVTRWDVTTLENQNPESVTSTMTYNTAGALLTSSDPLGHTVTISYTDSFSDNTNHNTLAYPTRVTDPDNYYSTTQYDYDMGVAKITTDPNGATLTKTFDSAGRVTRVDSNLLDANNNNAYTRFVYPNMNEVDTYVLQSTGPTVEIYSAQFFDGAGRLTGNRRTLPGSVGGYSAQIFVYDSMGRLSQRSNPTEVDGDWTPKGDDQTAGWLYTAQTYDWKGRPRITTNTDSTQRTVTYGGCGCAGGEVVTTQDEVGRQQRMTYDVLGRLYKTQPLNMDQSHSVYSTTTNTYNARDQLASVYVQPGTNGTGQTTSMTYDGHGRLYTRKLPAEDNITPGTVYAYYDDDTVQTVTDARDSHSTYSYNGRHLVTGITYCTDAVCTSKPQTPKQIDAIAPTPGVSFTYDAAGNRQSMTDGMGYVNYQYDTWSRLTSETRYFTELSASYALSYEYNLAGGLKKVIDPFNAAVNYSFNDSGQLTGATTTGFPGVTTLASGIQYRAWGGLKHGSYKTSSNGSTFSVDASYNGRLLMTHYTQAGGQFDYQHYADGRVSFAGDLSNPTIFDRKYSYDHVGRLTQGLTGSEARGGTTPDGPFKQTYSYDVFDNMTSRHNRFWSQPDDAFSGTYVNARNTAWNYDVAGNIKFDTMNHKYDVASRQVNAYDGVGFGIQQSYDGDGQPAKRIENRPSLTTAITTYYVRSSVLGGQVMTELSTTGFRAGTHNTHVYVSGTEIAVYDSWLNQVLTKLSDPVVGRGLDPLGGLVGFTDPFTQNPNTTYDSLHPGEALYLQDANPFDPGSGCELDGMPTDCSRLTHLLENGTVGVYIGAAGKLGKVYDVSNYQGGFGGMWVSVPTPSEPEYGKIPGHLKVTDNAYKDVWVPFGASFSSSVAQQFPGITTVGFRAYATDDCHHFADMVEQIANDEGNAEAFMDAMARTFTAANNSSISEMQRAANLAIPAGRPRFWDSGFRPEFRDQSNQVRHFTAGLIAGYQLGNAPGLYFMNQREEPNPGGVNDADIALNSISTELGQWSRDHRSPLLRFKLGLPEHGYKSLANEIRRLVCVY